MTIGAVRKEMADGGGRGLALPDAVSAGDSALNACYARYLADCCRRFLTLEPLLPPARRALHRQVATLVGRALAADRRRTSACFASSAVGTPLQCSGLLGQLPAFEDRIAAAVAGIAPHLLLEMALRGLLPAGESIVCSAWSGAPRLTSRSLGGEIVAPPGTTGLRFSASHLTALRDGEELARLPLDPRTIGLALAEESRGFHFERRYWKVGAVTQLATADHNPIAAFEEHPEKAGNHVDLGGRPASEWVGVLEQAFALVEQFLPGEHAEMRTMLHEAIPVGYDDHRHLSASYREAVGTIYLTLHPSVMIMTEAVIHEFQHNKFNVAAYATDFLTNAFEPRYKSPVRPDPRPLWGIMLAVHAFLPVAELYRRMRDAGHPLAAHPDFERRLSDIDLKNHEGMEMLRAHAELTTAGRHMFDELEALETRHMAERQAHGLATTPTEIHLA
jgi:HEXXH motif-containing protein